MPFAKVNGPGTVADTAVTVPTRHPVRVCPARLRRVWVHVRVRR
ncbi:protein of unknown function [Micropruina glycogenica]|uniref:Uncharacterized protein n=1 Tax=Micropruina glycogenica TaxID=75385 RepID=A0A2N9JHP8_9ACTN|nr:protein of unknown function [Micropruina glycogenica]